MSETSNPEPLSNKNFFAKTLGRIFHKERVEKNRTPERQSAQQYQEAHERVLRQIENSDDPKFRQNAQEVSDELSKLPGKKAFALIIDDELSKAMRMTQQIGEWGRIKGINYVIRNEHDGNEGIVLYEEFARMSPKEKVVVFMDGNLARNDTGPFVTERLIEAAKRHELPLPLIVGASGDEDKNEDIRDLNPEIFAGFYLSHLNKDINVHDVIAEKL